jgi:hypothetical protein
MKHVFAAAGLLLLSGVVAAQEGYTAKSLFFGEDGNVVATSATQKSPEAKPVKLLHPPEECRWQHERRSCQPQL